MLLAETLMQTGLSSVQTWQCRDHCALEFGCTLKPSLGAKDENAKTSQARSMDLLSMGHVHKGCM